MIGLAPLSPLSSRRRIAVAVWTTLVLMGCVVLSRTLGHQVVRALPALPLALWILGGTGASVASGAWLWSDSRRIGHWMGWGVACLFCGSWLPVATPLQAGCLLGVMLLHASLIAASQLPEEWAFALDQNSQPASGPTATAELPPATWTVTPTAVEGDTSAEQSMTRRIEDGQEVCEGRFKATFADGQRETTLHIAFCPPLPSVPQIELEDEEGHGWDLKIAAAYPYGMRIAVRRPVRDLAACAGHIAWWAAAAHPQQSAA